MNEAPPVRFSILPQITLGSSAPLTYSLTLAPGVLWVAAHSGFERKFSTAKNLLKTIGTVGQYAEDFINVYGFKGHFDKYNSEKCFKTDVNHVVTVNTFDARTIRHVSSLIRVPFFC